MSWHRAFLSLQFVCGAAAACELPSLPAIAESPEPGRELRRAQDQTQSYLEDMSAYVGCVQAEFESARAAGAADGVMVLLAERNNVAVAEFERVVELFRERVGPIQSLDVAAFGAPPADAGANTERCISVVRLRATRILNEHTVLFVRPTGRAFVSLLDTACPALLRSDGFSYEARGARNATLCQSDLIYPNGAAGAVGCPLGPFREIAASEAAAILGRSDDLAAERPEDFEPVVQAELAVAIEPAEPSETDQAARTAGPGPGEPPDPVERTGQAESARAD